MSTVRILIAAALLAPAVASAEKPSTLAEATHVGWFAGSTIDATTVDGEVPLAIGLRGGWQVDRSFGVGVAITGFAGPSSAADRGTPRGGYGGLLVRYAVGAEEVIHPYVEATLGYGYACILDNCSDAQQFYVFEPTVSVELNVASFARVALGGGYRVALTDNGQAFSARDLRALVVRATVELGQF